MTNAGNFRQTSKASPAFDDARSKRTVPNAPEAKVASSRVPLRVSYMEMVSGRPRPSRPPQYAKLESLLQGFSETGPGSSTLAPWIAGSSRSKGDKAVSYAQLRASSAQTVQYARRAVAKKLHPLERSQSAADDLLLGTKQNRISQVSTETLALTTPSTETGGSRPEPLRLGGKWKSYATHPLALASKVLTQAEADAVPLDDDIKTMLEHPLASSVMRGRILEWSQGIGWLTSSGGIPSLGKSIWMTELQRQVKKERAATTIQKMWRGFRHMRTYEIYREGRRFRSQQTTKRILTLWQRVGIQRPNARTPLSQHLIAWKVEICRTKIAREKAKDLTEIWETIQVMKNLRAWRALGGTFRWNIRRTYDSYVNEWRDFVFSQKVWRSQRARRLRKYMYHAFRTLYFWACCSAKCRRRSYKLFRYEEASVGALTGPVDRFAGYSSLFDCFNILEYFRHRDWYERRIIRCHYTRVVPRVLKCWRQSVEGGKKTRYAVLHRAYVVCRKYFGILKESGNALSSPNKASSSGDGGEQEQIEDSNFTVDAGILLQDDLDREVGDLMKLVDHEQRELFRRKLKRERKKLVVRVKLNALQQETELLKKISSQHDQSIAQMDNFFSEKQSQAEEKSKEEMLILQYMAKEEDMLWDEAKNRFVQMVQRGIDILTKCLQNNEQDYAWNLFSECWRLLKKPCATTRMMRICRKIMHTSILTRMLSVCSWFLRMEKSIHRYRPLKVKLMVWTKLLKTAETNYRLITPGLKARISRRRNLSDRFSDIIYEWGLNRNVQYALPDKDLVFERKDMILALWMESTQRNVTRREICWLFTKRRIIRVLHHSFLFLKDRVIRRHVQKTSTKTFLELNVSQDLLTWRRKYFMGMNHACYLRRMHQRLRQRAIQKIKNGTNLPNLLSNRRELLNGRCELEQCLLLRYCDVAFGKDDRKSDDRRGMGELYSSQVPLSNFLVNFGEQAVLRYLGTVFSQRKNELVSLLQRCDTLAQRARSQFDSAQVGYAVSNWLFRVRSFGLIKAGDRFLPRRRRYWKHVQDLFISAQSNSKV